MKLFTLAQAAAQLGISAGTLNVQARNGKLRAVKPGTDWLVTAEEIARYRSASLGRQRGKSETPEKSEPVKRASRQNGETAKRPARSVGKGYGVDGDVLVKATRWDDGTTTLEVETLADGTTPSDIIVDEQSEPPRKSEIPERFGAPRPAPKPRKKG